MGPPPPVPAWLRRGVRSLALVLVVTALPALVLSSAAPTAEAPVPLGARYRATINVTEHGIPHITAQDFGSLGFGSGYAAADASICPLADLLLTARGQRSLHLGPDGKHDDQVGFDGTNLEVDVLVADLRERRVVEDLMTSPAGPSQRARDLLDGYAAGVNDWLATHEIGDPTCAGADYARTPVDSNDLWYGVYLANLASSTTRFVKEIVAAAPPAGTGANQADGAVATVQGDRASSADPVAVRRALGRGDDRRFGSNATAIGGDASETGRGMLLGNPHFPWQGRYRFTQQHLTIPGRYNVAGASLVGMPVVNIGWNAAVAWSHTVSTAYRFTPYEYATIGPGTAYRSADGERGSAERRQVEVKVLDDDGSVRTAVEDVYRTPQGYVIDAPEQLMPWSTTSFWALRDANAEHLRTVDTFLSMGEATSARDLLRRQDAAGGMPWTNTVAADRDGEVLYADHSVVPHVTDEMAARCMTPTGRRLFDIAGLPGLDGTRADAECAFGSDADAQRPGIMGPARLPDTFRRDWVINANDSHWLPHPDAPLEGYSRIIGCERCTLSMRTRMVAQYVIDQLARRGKETPGSLRSHMFANRVRAAEVMRQDGALDRLCNRTGETDACRVLARWDGRSDVDSVGVHVFEEFVRRAPKGEALWRTPFDIRDPLGTPRGLRTSAPAVVDAMRAGIEHLRRSGVPFAACWCDLQVASDPGSPPIPVGGGDGDAAGNANALSATEPVPGTRYYRSVTSGSSHIQAIAFLQDGSVDARTLLSYGQYADPSSPWSIDQTRLFSRERWVRFPWTREEVRDATVELLRVGG